MRRYQRGFTLFELISGIVGIAGIIGLCAALYVVLHFVIKFW